MHPVLGMLITTSPQEVVHFFWRSEPCLKCDDVQKILWIFTCTLVLRFGMGFCAYTGCHRFYKYIP
jgi:hypothetical protein